MPKASEKASAIAIVTTPPITANFKPVPECSPTISPSVVIIPEVEPKLNPVVIECFIVLRMLKGSFACTPEERSDAGEDCRHENSIQNWLKAEQA